MGGATVAREQYSGEENNDEKILGIIGYRLRQHTATFVLCAEEN